MFSVTISGFAAKDAMTAYTSDGRELVRITVCVRNGLRSDGEKATLFASVVFSGRLASLAKKIEKGEKVVVIGDACVGQYQRNDGSLAVSFDVWGRGIEWLGRKGHEEEPAHAEAHEDDPFADE